MLKKFPELLDSLKKDPLPGVEVLDAFALPKGASASVTRAASGLGIYIHRDGNQHGVLIPLADMISLVDAAKKFATLTEDNHG